MKGDTCNRICDPKRDARFSWSRRGSNYCKHCDVLVVIETTKCPCCKKLLGQRKRDYVKTPDRH